LRRSADFQKVYRQGKRYDGVVMKGIVLSHKQSHHRFGITASRKAVGNAVDRNRARRLLRETFRLRTTSLSSLSQTYDSVINAQRRLPALKLSATIQEFEGLLVKVTKAESKGRE